MLNLKLFFGFTKETHDYLKIGVRFLFLFFQVLSFPAWSLTTLEECVTDISDHSLHPSLKIFKVLYKRGANLEASAPSSPHEVKRENRLRTLRDILEGLPFSCIKSLKDFELILASFEEKLNKKVVLQRDLLNKMLPAPLSIWSEASSFFLNAVKLENLTDQEIWEERAFHRWPRQTHAQHLCAEYFLPRGLWDEREGEDHLSEHDVFYRLTLCSYWKDPRAMQKLADELCLRFDQDPVNDEDAQIFENKEKFLTIVETLIQKSNEIFQTVLSNRESSPYLCALSHKYMRDSRPSRARKGSVMESLKKGVDHPCLSERLLCRFEQAGGFEERKRSESLNYIVGELDSLNEVGTQKIGPYHLTTVLLAYIERADGIKSPGEAFAAYVHAGERGMPFGFVKAASLLMNNPELDPVQTPDIYWEKAAEIGDFSGIRIGANFYWQEYQRKKEAGDYEKAKGLYQRLMDVVGDETGALNYAHLLKEERKRKEAFDLYAYFGDAYNAAKIASVGGKTYTEVLQAYVKGKIRLYGEVKDLINDLFI